MSVAIVEDDVTHLADYAWIPIGFSVFEVFDDQAIANLLRGDAAAATRLGTPYWKDYDAEPGGRPSDWQNVFDVSRWTILAAFVDSQRVGGMVIIHDDPQIELLHDCRDCTLIWDVRVAPTSRGRGVGSALLRAAEDAAIRRGAVALRVETQQINVPACRFYARAGFRLERAVRGAYRDLPAEIQLLWRKALP